MAVRDGRQVVFWVAVAGPLVLGAALFFRASEPARTALELVAAACGGSPDERLRLLKEHIADRLEVEIDRTGEEDGAVDGEPTELDRARAGLSPRPARASHGSLAVSWTQAEVSLKLVELNAFSPNCRLSLSNYSSHAGSDGGEWLEGDLDYTDSQSGDGHAQRRRLHAQFRRSGAAVLLERLLLGAIEGDESEARP